VRGDRGVVRLEVDCQMRTHAVPSEPLIEERREASRLMLIEEDAIGELSARARLA